VIYTQSVCNAWGTSIRLLFKTLDYHFFEVWCTAPLQMSTGVFVRAQAACFTQMPLMPLQFWKHSVSWVLLVWETLIEPLSLSCIPSGFPIDEKHLGVVCIYVHVHYSSFPIYDRHTNAEETTKQTLGMVRDRIM
jgi:hypothetical protein